MSYIRGLTVFMLPYSLLIHNSKRDAVHSIIGYILDLIPGQSMWLWFWIHYLETIKSSAFSDKCHRNHQIDDKPTIAWLALKSLQLTHCGPVMPYGIIRSFTVGSGKPNTLLKICLREQVCFFITYSRGLIQLFLLKFWFKQWSGRMLYTTV